MIQMKNLKVYCTYYTSDLCVFISVCVLKYCDAIYYLNISFLPYRQDFNCIVFN